MTTVDPCQLGMGPADVDIVPEEDECPVPEAEVPQFCIGTKAVIGAEVASFGWATGYVTDATRLGPSLVLHLQLQAGDRISVLGTWISDAPWWLLVSKIDWTHPQGPDPNADRSNNYSAVQGSWYDPSGSDLLAGKRFAAEALWKKVELSGLERRRLPWGNELASRGQHRCSSWRGHFPFGDTCEDDYIGTPYRPTGFNPYSTSDNVWNGASLTSRQTDTPLCVMRHALTPPDGFTDRSG